MDIIKAKEIVSALAEGIDPVTGEILPYDHICNNADVVRALYTLLQLESSNSNRNENKKTYENSGKKWSEEDDELLTELFNRGVKNSDLQKHFGRSYGSIKARLVRLGLIDEKVLFWKR